MKTVRTSHLEIAFEREGPANGPPLLLLHGWPDGPRAWSEVAQRLRGAGFQTIIPWLRGSEPTRFLSTATLRYGAAVALAQDAIDLANALELPPFAVIGHDWGARAVFFMAALYPERLSALVSLGVSYSPGGSVRVPSFFQSRLFWYQWFQCTPGGAAAVRKAPVEFARFLWDTWSPPGWYDEREFEITAKTFSHPDWADVALSFYRSRWLPEEPADPVYAPLLERAAKIQEIHIPTLIVHGAADTCVAASESAGIEKFFPAGFRRVVLDGVGHFPQREAPDAVARAILDFLPSPS